MIKEITYKILGMHCGSCEVLIEKKLLTTKVIKAVEASTKNNEVRITYMGEKPTKEKLNKLFKKDNYTFLDKPDSLQDQLPIISFDKGGQLLVNKEKAKNILLIAGISLFLITLFILLNRSGFSSLVNVNSASSIPAFFAFGLLAGFSSCAALVGGIVLSMSKQWGQFYKHNESIYTKLQPHILFNTGRIFSYAMLGGILGAIGSTLRTSLTLTSILTFAISILMILMACQMLGVKALRKFRVSAPKFITRYIADDSHFRGRLMPPVMGALTFFLPCGFTITAQGLALASGSAIRGSLIMLFFALGTLPSLLAIGLSSTSLYRKPHLSDIFLKIAGVLVLFFALYTINSQLNLLGIKSLNDFNFARAKETSISDDDLVPIIDGKQVMKMEASSKGYSPNYFKVQVGIPVRWEITNKGVSGCTNAVIAKGLFDGEIRIDKDLVTKEFTPNEVGKYKFSCWMGMVTGVIEVVDDSGSSGSNDVTNEAVTTPANGSCGGTCGGTCGGSCGGSCGDPNCEHAR